MILNKNLLLAEDQAVTATAISENVIAWNDLSTPPYESGAPDRNLGAGTPIPILVQVTEDFATLTSLTITLESSAAAGLTSPTVHFSTGAIAAADLVAGYYVGIRFIPDGTMGKYLGLRFTVAGSDATAGKITAAVATEVQSA